MSTQHVVTKISFKHALFTLNRLENNSNLLLIYTSEIRTIEGMSNHHSMDDPNSQNQITTCAWSKLIRLHITIININLLYICTLPFENTSRYQLLKKKKFKELTFKNWKRDGIEILKSFMLLDNVHWLIQDVGSTLFGPH